MYVYIYTYIYICLCLYICIYMYISICCWVLFFETILLRTFTNATPVTPTIILVGNISLYAFTDSTIKIRAVVIKPAHACIHTHIHVFILSHTRTYKTASRGPQVLDICMVLFLFFTVHGGGFRHNSLYRNSARACQRAIQTMGSRPGKVRNIKRVSVYIYIYTYVYMYIYLCICI
jgi:hypothetical protein